MVYRPSDNGPYWMMPKEQQQIRNDHYGTTVILTKEYTKPQLVEMIRQKGIDNPKGSEQQIKNMAERADISLT